MVRAVFNLGGLIVQRDELCAHLGVKAFDKMMNKLTFVHVEPVGPPKRAFAFREKTTGVDKLAAQQIRILYLPRACLSAIVAAGVDVEIMLPPVVAMRGVPRADAEIKPNQQIIVDYLMANVFTEARIARGMGSAILDLRAGFGKSFVAAALIARLGMRALFITTKKPLKMQAIIDLRGFMGPGVIVGAYGELKKSDPTSVVENQDITVIIIDSAMKLEHAFFAQYSVIIFDEVHSYCSTVRQEIFWRTNGRACLGMSATTSDRIDNFDGIAHKALCADGRVIAADAIPGFGYDDIAFDCNVSLVAYKGAPEYTQVLTNPSNGKMSCALMHAQITRDPTRMELVMREIMDLYNWTGEQGQKHCIYVFSEIREPLGRMAEQLRRVIGNVEPVQVVDAEEIIEADEAINVDEAPDAIVGEFIGGITNDEISDIKANSRILLTTYGYASTGISINKMTAIVFLTSRRSGFKQILARIMRRGSDMSIKRQVVDIIDSNTPLRSQLSSRKLAYKHYNMNIAKR